MNHNDHQQPVPSHSSMSGASAGSGDGVRMASPGIPSAAWTWSPRPPRARSSTTAAPSTSAAAIAWRSSRPIRRVMRRPAARSRIPALLSSTPPCRPLWHRRPRPPARATPARCIRRSSAIGPGACPICGMALEPMTVAADDEADPELADMTRRFWISLALTVPLLLLAMGEMIPGLGLHAMLGGPGDGLGPARAGDARGPLGRMAVLRARLVIAREPPAQHVHADRDGDRHGLSLQRRRRDRARRLPGLVPGTRRRSRSTSSPRR